MKKIIIASCFLSILAIVGSGFFLWSLFAGDTDTGPIDFKGSIDECITARKTIPQTPIKGDAFFCPEGPMSDEAVAYQVVLDLKFRRIDKEVEKWFQNLSSPESKGKSPAELSVDIDNAFWVTSWEASFYLKYMNICRGEVVTEVKKHFEKLTTANGVDWVITWGASCERLAATKIGAYRNAAWTIATANMVENYQSDKKTFTDKLKTKYRDLIMKLAVYTDKLSRIEKKWDRVTKNAQ